MPDWEAEARRLEKELSDLNHTFNDFQATSEEVEAELDLALKAAVDKNNSYEVMMRGMEDKVASLTSSNVNYEKIVSKHLADMKTLQSERESLMEVKRRLETENDSLQMNERVLSSTIDNMRDKLDQAMEDKILVMGDLEELRHSRDEEVARLMDHVKEVEADMLAQSKRLAASTGNGDRQTEIDDLKVQVAELLTALTEEEEKYEKLASEVAETNKHDTAVLARGTQASQSSSDSNNHVGIIMSLEEEKAQLEDANNQLSEELTNMTDDIMAQSQKIRELEADIKQKDRIIAEYKVQEVAVNEQLSVEQSKTSDNISTKRKLEEEVNKGKIECQLLRDQVVEKTTLLREIEDSLAVLKASYNAEADNTRDDTPNIAPGPSMNVERNTPQAITDSARSAMSSLPPAAKGLVTGEVSVEFQQERREYIAQIDKMQVSMQKRELELQDTKDSVATLQTMVSKLEGTISKLEEREAAAINARESLFVVSSELEIKIKILEQDLHKENERVAAMTKRVKEEEEVCARLRSTLSSQAAVNSSMSTSVKEISAKLAESEARNEKNEAIINENQQKIKSLEDQILGLTASPHPSHMRKSSVTSVISSHHGHKASLSPPASKAISMEEYIESINSLTAEIGSDQVKGNTFTVNSLNDLKESELAAILKSSSGKTSNVTEGREAITMKSVHGLMTTTDDMVRCIMQEISTILASIGTDKTEGYSDSKIRSIRSDFMRLHDILMRFYNCFGTAFGSVTTQLVKLCSELVLKCGRYVSANSELLHRIQTYKGNIMVFVRVKPLLVDGSKSTSSTVDVLGESEIAFFDKRSEIWRPFAVDHVFEQNASQEEIFAEVMPLAASVAQGYNACIIAYGQTGSGKTFTMEGTEENPGINYRMLFKIFELLALSGGGKDGKAEISVAVSYLEVYNEEVKDLLATKTSEDAKKLEIRRSTAEGDLHVSGLTTINVTAPDDVLALFRQGKLNRATAATNINEHSSRSHAILVVEVTKDNSHSGGGISKGKLYLVDLAGSENVKKSEATGARLVESQNINKSLSALGDVMQALDTKAKHIPYRNSKLTYLLQDALGSSSKTLMLCTVTPTEDTAIETAQTLQFAQRVRSIDLGPVRKQILFKNTEAELRELKLEAQKQASAKSKAVSKLQEIKDRYAAEQKKAMEQEEKVSHSVELNARLKTELSSLKKSEMDIKAAVRLHHEQLSEHKMKLEAADSEIQSLKKELMTKNKEAKEATSALTSLQLEHESVKREFHKLSSSSTAKSRNSISQSTVGRPSVSGNRRASLRSDVSLSGLVRDKEEADRNNVLSPTNGDVSPSIDVVPSETVCVVSKTSTNAVREPVPVTVLEPSRAEREESPILPPAPNMLDRLKFGWNPSRLRDLGGERKREGGHVKSQSKIPPSSASKPGRPDKPTWK